MLFHLFVVESDDLEGSPEMHPKSVKVLPAKMFETSSPSEGSSAVGNGVDGDEEGVDVGFSDGALVGETLGGSGNIIPAISISA